jgi:hypothetical protein
MVHVCLVDLALFEYHICFVVWKLYNDMLRRRNKRTDDETDELEHSLTIIISSQPRTDKFRPAMTTEIQMLNNELSHQYSNRIQGNRPRRKNEGKNERHRTTNVLSLA